MAWRQWASSSTSSRRPRRPHRRTAVAEGAGLRALQALLSEVNPTGPSVACAWCEPRRTNDLLWVCLDHYPSYVPSAAGDPAMRGVTKFKLYVHVKGEPAVGLTLGQNDGQAAWVGVGRRRPTLDGRARGHPHEAADGQQMTHVTIGKAATRR
jgi:hypothetical protein